MTWTEDVRQLPPGTSAAGLADIAAQIGTLDEAGQAEAFAQAQAAAEALIETGLIDASTFPTAVLRIHGRLLGQLACRQLSGLAG